MDLEVTADLVRCLQGFAERGIELVFTTSFMKGIWDLAKKKRSTVIKEANTE